MQEYKVMNGNDALYRFGLSDIKRKFVAQTVENLRATLLHARRYAEGSPQRAEHLSKNRLRIADFELVIVLVSPKARSLLRIWSVKKEFVAWRMLRKNIEHKTAVVSKPRAILCSALGIKCYYHLRILYLMQRYNYLM
jgi:hypothetical protein